MENIKYKILYEKDFKEDIQQIYDLCECMLNNAEYIIENRKCEEKIYSRLYINKSSIESIKKWLEGVLKKSETEKESGRRSIKYTIRHINNFKK